MLAIHHPGFWLLTVLMIDTGCALALVAVANARGQSKLFAFWGILGFAGLLAGLLIMLAMPTHQPPQAPPMQPQA